MNAMLIVLLFMFICCKSWHCDAKTAFTVFGGTAVILYLIGNERRKL
jgi:hypothetical protein